MSAFELPHSPVDVERLLSERQWVQRLARSLVADPNQADDLAQESWLTALRHPPRHDANLRSWLSRLVRNTAAGLRRGETRRSERERSSTAPTVTAGSSDALERAEVVRELVEAVLALDKPRREALVLVYFEGLEPNVAADQLGIPHSTLRTHVRRGLAEVREKLERKRGPENWLAAVTVLACRPETHVVGITLMKMKLAAALVVIVAAFLIYRGWFTSSSTPIASNRVVASEPLEVVKDQPIPVVASADPSARTVIAPITAATKNELVVEAKWDATGLPADNVQIAVNWTEASGTDSWRQTRTDSAGRATFAGVPAQAVRISADRGFDGKTDVAAEGTTVYELRIVTEVHVRGRVVGPDEEPIGGASIYLSGQGGHGFEEPLTESTADGRFDIGDVSRFRSVHARRDGFAASTAVQLMTVQTPEIDVVLRMQKPGCELIGRVVRRDGSPIADAEVVAGAYSGVTRTREGLSQSAPPARRVVTDAQGGFRLVGLFGGAHTLQVRRQGFGVKHSRVELSSLRPTSIEITLVPGVRVHGVVRDESGQVVANALVNWADRGDSQTSAADGSFSFTNVEPGSARFRVKSKTSGLQIGTLEIPEQEQFEWNPIVGRGRLLEGRVVNEAGLPLANWLVQVQMMSNQIDPDEPELDVESDFDSTRRTDAEGRFMFSNRSGLGRQVLIKSPESGYVGLPALVVDDVKAGTPGLVFRVPDSPGVTVRGRIVDESGNGIGGASVVIGKRVYSGVSSAARTTTEERTGAFSIDKIQPGMWEIRVSAKGASEYLELRVIDESSAELEPIQLVRGGSVVVTLSAEHADIVRTGRANLFVRGLREHQLSLVGTEARVDDLQPGEWRVESIGARRMVPGPSITFEVRAGEVTRIDYDLGKLATLKQ